MSKEKIAITLDRNALNELDSLISKDVFQNRSQAIQEAVREKLARIKRTRLIQECAKLEPESEKTLAEEGIAGELQQWPEY